MCRDAHFVIINGNRLSTCLLPMVHTKPHKSIHKYIENKFLINGYLILMQLIFLSRHKFGN